MTTTQPVYAPSITFAQQAVQIYDQKGEFAMLPFIMANIDSWDEAPLNWAEQGYCLLDDSSDVVHYDQKYTFGWYDQHTNKQVHVERPASMPDNGRPEPTRTSPPAVIRWPNRDQVWRATANIIVAMANTSQDHVFDDGQAAYRLSPSLYHSITRAMAEASTREYVKHNVDSICSAIAETAIKLVQPDELQALVAYASKPHVKPV